MRNLSIDGKLRESLFLATFEPNRRNFKSASGLAFEDAPVAEDQHTFSVEEALDTGARQAVGPARTATGSGRGATMVYVPTINPSTFLHFSWLNESCAIRDYSKSPNIMPFEDRNSRTSDVRRRITKEVVIRNRRPISDTRYWYETTMNLNLSELSITSGNRDLGSERPEGR